MIWLIENIFKNIVNEIYKYFKASIFYDISGHILNQNYGTTKYTVVISMHIYKECDDILI